MKTCEYILILLCAGILSGCNDGRNLPEPVVSGQMWFSAASVEGSRLEPSTRSFVENLDGLQNACTPEPSGLGLSIGVWADYTKDGVKLPNFFKDAELKYQDKTGGNPYSFWNYAGKDYYWAVGGEYQFRAYFPKGEIDSYIVPSSNASSFVVDYNTNVVQCDLLLADATVSTALTIPSAPVPLAFRHALSAVRFKFVLGYPGTDALTSCWLENTGQSQKERFVDVGMLVYGTQADAHAISWTSSNHPTDKDQIYIWKHKNGVGFTDTDPVLAYTGTEAELHEGKVFVDNAGWLLVVPQQYYGKLALCFTTQVGGNKVYRIPIPASTATEDAGRHYYRRGMRYTYTIRLGATDADLSVSIADWNRIDSSFETSN